MMPEKKKNWIQIEAFDKLHPMTVTEYNEFGGSVSSTSVASYGIDNSPKYRKSDIDARIKFYDEHKTLRKSPDWLQDLYRKNGICYIFRRWIFYFCFGNMQEDFIEKIKNLEIEK